jgi:hypothetical protein
MFFYTFIPFGLLQHRGIRFLGVLDSKYIGLGSQFRRLNRVHKPAS